MFLNDVLGFSVYGVDNRILMKTICNAIDTYEKTCITYVTAANCIIYKRDLSYSVALRKFSIIHPDGIGIYLAQRFLYPDERWNRMTGSDFYPILAEKAIEKQWSLFIFGDKKETLESIPKRYPKLKIAGMHSGFGFPDNLSEDISASKPDLVLVGLGVPMQEKWISDNWERLPSAVYLAVGDGLKVLSGTKRRGGKFIQKAGLEWVVRLLSEPFRLWKRYLIWMPVFIILVVLQKFQRKK
ncbi:MAG: WecB/TagA/CpsF family glycosyltransferase [Ignavibacteriales bacterium]|nr:MAG: WecB/TagA/CpsF family glycosyltransferase [Ignavibacteriales bacterium]